MEFSELADKIRRGRNGKAKLCYATYAHVRDGTKAEPKLIAIRHHWTDILLYRPDGTVEVRTDSLCESITTRERLKNYARIYLTNRALPAVNNYAVRPGKAMFMSYGWSEPFVAYNSNEGYIRLNADKTIDMSTVKPYEVTVIEKPTEMRRVMLEVGRIVKLALSYQKLKDNDDMFRKGRISPCEWLAEQYERKIQNTDLTNLPYISGDPRSKFKEAMEVVRWKIARSNGYVGTRDVLTG